MCALDLYIIIEQSLIINHNITVIHSQRRTVPISWLKKIYERNAVNKTLKYTLRSLYNQCWQPTRTMVVLHLESSNELLKHKQVCVSVISLLLYYVNLINH